MKINIDQIIYWIKKDPINSPNINNLNAITLHDLVTNCNSFLKIKQYEMKRNNRHKNLVNEGLSEYK